VQCVALRTPHLPFGVRFVVHPATLDPHGRTPASLRVAVVIPARYQSSRLPGKALADIGGRTMIERVYQRASAARGVDQVGVATDDERIAAAVHGFGGTVWMTRLDHRSGTDRVAEVARALTCDVVVNLQGDEPAIHPKTIEAVIEPMRSPDIVMTTLRRAIDDPHELDSPHVVKVVVDRTGDAMYFSRARIPRAAATPPTPVFKHIGLYAYRREFLLRLAALPPTPLEIAESLEQLRALEHGFRVRVVETTFDSIGVDTPEDLERARQQLRELAADARA
jgi:3-deoxy-manno-octulosonate cytidylyltransferase (CMP-KDO synthetase)